MNVESTDQSDVVMHNYRMELVVNMLPGESVATMRRRVLESIREALREKNDEGLIESGHIRVLMHENLPDPNNPAVHFAIEASVIIAGHVLDLLIHKLREKMDARVVSKIPDHVESSDDESSSDGRSST